MNQNPQFFTRWKPLTQAGKRHRSFVINAPQTTALWTGFSRPILSVDISGAKTIAGVKDLLSARPIIAVSVVTWDDENTVPDHPNIKVLYQYMIRRAQAVNLDYIPDYQNERLLSRSAVYFWTAPPPFGTAALTAFSLEILTYGQYNPFNSTGYLTEQTPLDLTYDNLLYTVDYPVPHATVGSTIYSNVNPIS